MTTVIYRAPINREIPVAPINREIVAPTIDRVIIRAPRD